MAEDDKAQRAGKPDKAAAEGGKPAKAPRPDKGGADKAAKGQKGPPGKEGKGAPRDKGAQPKEKVARAPRPKDYKPRMKMHYEKIVLNMGVGEAVNDRKKVDSAAKDLAMISGQRPVITRARKSIATYKLRDGMAIGAKVTLRGDRMYEFVDRLVTIALPRVKDFRGLNPKSFDGRGNFALGLKEHIVFPEIDYDQVDEVWGMDVIVCTTAGNDDEARALLRGFNFPFRT